MKEFLIRCDRALVSPKTLKQFGSNVREISHRGESPQLNISVRTPVVGFDNISGRAADLVLIAAYAFAADQEVSRGGDADVYGSRWSRSFRMALPVADADFWNQPGVNTALCSVLQFASDDQWSFDFLDGRKQTDHGPLHLQLDPTQTLGSPDLIALMSGGLDSLGSVIEQVTKFGRRPAIVGHSQNFHIEKRQASLCRELRRRIPDVPFPVVSAAVHRWKSDAPETTQRTRSFLYACLAVAVGASLQIDDIHLADNGPVSVNLPISDQILGAMATRSTHPRFLRLLNALLELTFPKGPRVSNPVLHRTRTSVLGLIADAGLAELLPLTNSCAHQRNRTRAQPYCGLCSQCIDRRFAVLAAGLEEFDPPERYEKDVFIDPLIATNHRTLALGFYQTALRIRALSDDEMWNAFPLAELIDPRGLDQRAEANLLTEMLRSQSTAILEAMERVIQGRALDLTMSGLSPDCLVALVASQANIGARDQARRPAGSFLHSADYRSITFGQSQYALREGPALAVSLLHAAANNGTPDVPWRQLQALLNEQEFGARSMGELFRSVPDWKTLVGQRSRGSYRLNFPESAAGELR